MPNKPNEWRVLAKWVVCLTSMTLVSPLVSIGQEQASEDADAEELESFVMTGSRIRRLDVETVNPVISMTAADIQQTGFTTIGEALRSLPFNSGQSLVPNDAGTSFTPGISTANLRGLGNNNTLVLINGRRTAPYAAPGFDGLQTMFDFNSIPESAIDSIEILKDGASAIYGSDAVSGVININLKKDYQGFTTSMEVGNYFDVDAYTRQVDLVVGTSSAKTSMITAISASWEDAIYAKDLDYTRDADRTMTQALDAKARWKHVDGNGKNVASQLDAALKTLEIDLAYWENDFLEAANTWFDLRSSRGFPGYLNYNGRNYTANGPVGDPTMDDLVPGTNLFNYQLESGFKSEVKKYSIYNRTVHTFSDFVEGFIEASYSRVESKSESASTPIDIEDSKGLTEGDAMYMPASNPYNPFGEDIYYGRYRFVEMGPRVTEVQSDSPRIVAGLEGEFGDGWNWDTAFLYASNRVADNSLVAIDYKMQQALLGLGVNSDGTLFWDPNLPADQRRYFNWFGYDGREMVDFLTAWNPTHADYRLTQVDAHLSGSIFELPAGTVGVAGGLEARKENLENVKSELNATGMVLGGSTGTGFKGDRDILSLYVEMDIPIFKNLEVQLAGRYEDYSDDGFESDVRPKIALKYKPTSWLLLRGSYSESFKAPDLAYLYTASSNSFSSFQFVDPVTMTEIDQIQIVTSGNPELEPELTDSYYGGIAFEPGDKLFNGWLDGLTISVDYFELEQKNLLAQLSDFYGYSDFFTGAAAGDPLFADKVVRSPSTNEVLYIKDLYENLSDSEYNGWDFEVSYTWKTENFGEYIAELDLTYLEEYSIDGDNVAGSRLFPRLRGNFMLQWRKGDWSASVFVNYIRGREVTYWDTNVSYYTEAYFGEGVPDDYVSALVYDVDDQYVVNPRLSYSGLWGSTFTLGVNNVFNSEPPADPQETSGGTVGVNYVEPAFWYLKWEKTF